MAKAYRAYFITSNNPQRYYDWAADITEASTAKEFRKALEASVSAYAKGANGRERDPAKNGVIAVFERGSCLHAHHLVMSASPVKFDALQKKFNHSEIEPVRGTAQEAIRYIRKQGQFEDKADTQLCEPVAWGDFVTDNKGASEDRPVFAEIDRLLEQGLSPKEIYRLGAKYSFYRSSIETAYNARMAVRIPQVREIASYYHLGASGTGKSHTVLDLQEKYGVEGVFMVNGQYKNIWDTYNYEPCVLLDDFRGAAMPLYQLNGLLDCYYTLARCRYADKPLAFTEIHLTSVIPPERLYEYDTDETFQQLKRRISHVVFHYLDPTQDSPYQKLSVPGSEYQSYEELKRMAAERAGLNGLLWKAR